MKKIITLTVFIFIFLAQSAFAGDVRLSPAIGGLRGYVKLFVNRNGTPASGYDVRMGLEYFQDRNTDIYRQIAELDNNPKTVDTTLEFALMSYFTATVNSRPVQATKMLPANSKQSDLILGGNIFKEIQILRFLGDTKAVGRYEGMLKFITDRKNVTRSDIEAYYKQNIATYVSEIVDEQMAKCKPTNPVFVSEIKQIMTNFFLNPTRENHNVLYKKNRQYASTDGQRGANTSLAFTDAIAEFNSFLADTVINPSRLTSK